MLKTISSRLIAAVALVAACALVVATHIEASPSATHGDRAAGSRNKRDQYSSTDTRLPNFEQKEQTDGSKDEDRHEPTLFKHNKFHVLRGRPDLKVRMVSIGSEVSIGACGDMIIEKSGRVGLWQKGNCYTTEEPFVNKAQLYNRKGERLLSFTGELKQRGDELAAKVGPSTNEATWLQMQWNDNGNIELGDFNYGNEEHLHMLNFVLIQKE